MILSFMVEHLGKEAVLGRLDGSVVDALARPTAASHVTMPGRTESGAMLSPREIEVLRVSLGESNKEAALRLGISPSTVRTNLQTTLRPGPFPRRFVQQRKTVRESSTTARRTQLEACFGIEIGQQYRGHLFNQLRYAHLA
jgi:FixJ family two-component response regulator